jgi:hypothetical protein
MNGASKTWWEEAQPDWTSGEPARLVDVLARAYEERPAIEPLAEAIGIDLDGGPQFGSTRETWTWFLSEAARLTRLLDLVAAVLNDSRSTAFHAPLTSLLGDRAGSVNARRTIRYGLPPPAEGQDKVLESVVSASTEPSDEPLTGLEAITSVSEGFGDPLALAQAIIDATRRTAMIEVSGQPRGTGFLVGADLLLTAAHVIDPRHWPPSPQQPVEAVFDYVPMPGRSQAEIGARVPVAAFVTGSLPTPGEVGGWPENWDAPADRLDFALLKLGTKAPPPSDQQAAASHRGAYRIEATEYDFPRSPLLLVVQHPLGDFKRYTFIKNPPEPNGGGTRIRYRGNTLQGSSGSPIVDIRGRLVGLHHFSQRGQNQGVPISIIASKLLSGAHAELFTAAPEEEAPIPASDAVVTVNPFEANELMGRPFVNRQRLRERISEMAEDDTGAVRTLAISGESGSGVSYSYMLASHVAAQSKLCDSLRAAAPDGLAAFKIDLRDYIRVGVDERRTRIAEDILVNLEMREPVDPLAQEARNTTTLQVWIKTTLRRNPERQWWIFFDSIDSVVEVQQGEVDELIHAMMALADEPQVPLRVVLAGRKAQEFAQARTSWMHQDTAVGLVRSDVEGWLRARAREEGRTIDASRLDAQLAELFPDGGPLPEPKRLAPRLPTVLLDLLDGAGNGS